MDKCREAFEAKYRELNPNDKCTLMANGNYSGWIKQAHWWAWQSRQAEVDELQEEYAETELYLRGQLTYRDSKIANLEYLLEQDMSLIPILNKKLEEKDKRIEELESALTQIKSWESHPKNYETNFGSWGLRDFYRDLADKALRGEHE